MQPFNWHILFKQNAYFAQFP